MNKHGNTRPTLVFERIVEGGHGIMFRTVTHIIVGMVFAYHERINAAELIHAAWVADTGRWADALRTGELNEVEPYPDNMPVMVPLASCVDIFPWEHPLPLKQK